MFSRKIPQCLCAFLQLTRLRAQKLSAWLQELNVEWLLMGEEGLEITSPTLANQTLKVNSKKSFFFLFSGFKINVERRKTKRSHVFVQQKSWYFIYFFYLTRTFSYIKFSIHYVCTQDSFDCGFEWKKKKPRWNAIHKLASLLNFPEIFSFENFQL